MMITIQSSGAQRLFDHLAYWHSFYLRTYPTDKQILMFLSTYLSTHNSHYIAVSARSPHSVWYFCNINPQNSVNIYCTKPNAEPSKMKVKQSLLTGLDRP